MMARTLMAEAHSQEPARPKYNPNKVVWMLHHDCPSYVATGLLLECEHRVDHRKHQANIIRSAVHSRERTGWKQSMREGRQTARTGN